MISVTGVSKRFGRVRALEEVTFTARDGAITGLLGPNGAGKSTCLRILATILSPDSGTARFGHFDLRADPMDIRRAIGVLPHNAGLYPHLTSVENIRYYGVLQGLESSYLEQRISELVDRLDMAGIADRRVGGFSEGQRTRVALARALVHDPHYILLDEPTSGLDVMSTRELRSWLRLLAEDGRCVLLSSHVMQEVAALANDIVIIAGGRVVASGTPDSLAEAFGITDLEEIFVTAVRGK